MNSNVNGIRNKYVLNSFCSVCANHFTYLSYEKWDGLQFVDVTEISKMPCTKCGHSNNTHIGLEELPFRTFSRVTFDHVMSVYIHHKRSLIFNALKKDFEKFTDKHKENDDIVRELKYELEFNESKLEKLKQLGHDFDEEVENIKKLITSIKSDLASAVLNLEESNKKLNNFNAMSLLTKQFYGKDIQQTKK